MINRQNSIIEIILSDFETAQQKLQKSRAELCKYIASQSPDQGIVTTKSISSALERLHFKFGESNFNILHHTKQSFKEYLNAVLEKKSASDDYRSNNNANFELFQILADENNVSPKQIKMAWVKNDEHSVLIHNNQFKAKLKESLSGTLKELKDLQPKFDPPTKSKSVKRQYMLEISPSDLHLGKRGVDGKTDEELLEEYFNGLETILKDARAHENRFERVLLVFGNDFLNIDNLAKTTTAGTPQDASMGYYDLFKMGLETLVQSIETVRLATKNASKIDVVVIPGNHDRNSCTALKAFLSFYYEKDRIVNVHENNQTMGVFGIRYGKNGIGLLHGDNLKWVGKSSMKDLFYKQSGLSKEDILEIEHIEIQHGHFHRKSEKVFDKSFDNSGVLVRCLPSLSTADQWHYDNNFLGNKRTIEGYVYHREDGCVATHSAHFKTKDIENHLVL